jgi:hypothetical protein
MSYLLRIAFLLAAISAFSFPLKAQQILWEAQVGHSYQGSSGPRYRDEIISVMAFDTMVVAVGNGWDEDTNGIVRICSYIYAYNFEGRKLWETRLHEYAFKAIEAIKVTDTSWVLSCEYPYSSTDPIAGQQNGGVSLRLYNLRMQELWRWSLYENNPYSISASLPTPRPGKIIYSTTRYDTTLLANLTEVRTFNPDGLVEHIDTSYTYSTSSRALSPMPDGGWITLSLQYVGPSGYRYSIHYLNSSFQAVRTDTAAVLASVGSGNPVLFPAPDGGYQLFWSGTLASPGNDTTWLHTERHNAQGRLVWQRALPRNSYWRYTAKGLSDGGWLWVRRASKRETADSDRVYFERMKADGAPVWSVEMPTFASTGQRTGYSFLDVAFDGQGGGYVCGQVQPAGAGANDRYGYVRRVANLGLPYNPLAARPGIVSVRGQLQVYPNPASAKIHVQGLAGKQAILLSADGRVLYLMQLDGQGRGETDIAHLPRGLYLIRSDRSVTRVVIQ